MSAPGRLETLLAWAKERSCLIQFVGTHLVVFPPVPRSQTEKVAWTLEDDDSALDALEQVLERAKSEDDAFLIHVRNLKEQREAEREQASKKGRR